MGLFEIITKDWKVSLKSGNVLNKEILSSLRSEIQRVSKDKNQELSETDIIKIIGKEKRQRLETADGYKKVNNIEAALVETSKAMVLDYYLPKQISDGQLEPIIRAEIAKQGATEIKQMGGVIKAVTQYVAGAADGKRISEMTKRLIGEGI